MAYSSNNNKENKNNHFKYKTEAERVQIEKMLNRFEKMRRNDAEKSISDILNRVKLNRQEFKQSQKPNIFNKIKTIRDKVFGQSKNNTEQNKI